LSTCHYYYVSQPRDKVYISILAFPTHGLADGRQGRKELGLFLSTSRGESVSDFMVTCFYFESTSFYSCQGERPPSSSVLNYWNRKDGKISRCDKSSTALRKS